MRFFTLTALLLRFALRCMDSEWHGYAAKAALTDRLLGNPTFCVLYFLFNHFEYEELKLNLKLSFVYICLLLSFL